MMHQLPCLLILAFDDGHQKTLLCLSGSYGAPGSICGLKRGKLWGHILTASKFNPLPAHCLR